MSNSKGILVMLLLALLSKFLPQLLMLAVALLVGVYLLLQRIVKHAKGKHFKAADFDPKHVPKSVPKGKDD